MSSYYDTINSASHHLDVIEQLAALVIVRDEWSRRINVELFVALKGCPEVEGTDVIVAAFEKLSGRVDDLTSRDEPPQDIEVGILLGDFHSLAHRLGSMRLEYYDAEGEKHIAFDNPNPPLIEWTKYLATLAELRAMFKSKGGAA